MPTHVRRFLAAAVLLLLAACNPLGVDAERVALGYARADAVYAGPAGAWLEVSITAPRGYDIRYEVAVNLGHNFARSCRDAATGVPEPCLLVDGFVISDTYPASATHRATLSPEDADPLTLLIHCRQGGADVECPDLDIELRVAGPDGGLVGDLR